MNQTIEALIEKNGWNTDSLNTLLLDFVEKAGLTDQFVSFLEDNDMSDDKPDKHIIGMSTAIKEVEEDSDFNLYLCEVGLFSAEDSNTPHEIYEIAIACEDKDGVPSLAVHYANSHLAKLNTDSFNSINDVEELDPDEYTAS